MLSILKIEWRLKITNKKFSNGFEKKENFLKESRKEKSSDARATLWDSDILEGR